MGNVHNIKNTSKRSGTAYISKNRSLYNVVFTILNYHSVSDQVHPRNNAYTKWLVGWLVGCFWFNGPLRQYFSLYRAVSQREGERREK